MKLSCMNCGQDFEEQLDAAEQELFLDVAGCGGNTLQSLCEACRIPSWQRKNHEPILFFDELARTHADLPHYLVNRQWPSIDDEVVKATETIVENWAEKLRMLMSETAAEVSLCNCELCVAFRKEHKLILQAEDNSGNLTKDEILKFSEEVRAMKDTYEFNFKELPRLRMKGPFGLVTAYPPAGAVGVAITCAGISIALGVCSLYFMWLPRVLKEYYNKEE